MNQCLQNQYATPSIYIFYGIKVYKKSIFFDHLPPSSCKRSLRTAPNVSSKKCRGKISMSLYFPARLLCPLKLMMDKRVLFRSYFCNIFVHLCNMNVHCTYHYILLSSHINKALENRNFNLISLRLENPRTRLLQLI